MGENPPEDYVPEHRGEEPKSHTPLSNTAYDKLKWFALIVLPALGVLYFTLGEVWGLPHVKEVVGTCSALGTFLGVLLGLSTQKHNNDPARFAGKVVYQDVGGNEPQVDLVLDKSPQEFQGQKEVTFKVIDDTR